MPVATFPAAEARLTIAPVFRSNHALEDKLAEKEDGLGVDVQHAVPVSLGHVEQVDDLHDPGVVDQDVDRTKLRLGRLNHMLAARVLPYVSTDCDSLAIEPANLRGNALGTGRVNVRNTDVGASARGDQSHRAANPASPAGHQNGLAGQKSFNW